MEYLLNDHIMRNMTRSSAVNKKENSSEYLPETGVLKVFHGLSTIHSENIQKVVHRKRLHFHEKFLSLWPKISRRVFRKMTKKETQYFVPLRVISKTGYF